METENRLNLTDRGSLPGGDVLNLVTICVDSDTLSQLKHFLDSARVGRLRAELRHYLPSEADSALIEQLKDPAPDICLIDFDRDREKAMHTAERIHEAMEQTAIFATSANSQADLIISAMRCGCSEYLVKPINSDQMLEALGRVGSRKREKREQVAGQILVFLGAKGGSGVTTLATHLGALLATPHHRKTLLIDLHPDLGDASLYLSLPRQQYHFYELVENTHRLDMELLQSFLVRHPSGLEVLPAPDGFEAPRQVPVEALERTLEFLRFRYEFVLVDCPPGLQGQTMTVMGRADRVYLVATPEIPALRNVARYLEQLARHDFPADKVQAVINRHSRKADISDEQIEKAIRKPIAWKVPNQYADVIKTIHAGAPISATTNTEFMRNLNRWAEKLSGKPSGGPKKQEGKGILGLWGN